MSKPASAVLDHVELWRNQDDGGVYLTIRDARLTTANHEVVVYVSPRLAAHKGLAPLLSLRQ